MHRRSLFAAIALVLSVALPAWSQDRGMRIATVPETDPATSIAELVLKDAYAQLGMGLEVKRMPGERALYSANNGEMDGELYRKLGIERDYPNLMIIPVPLLTYEIVIFTNGADFVVNGWESLRPFVVGYVKGIKIVEQNTLGMKIEQTATLRQAFLKMQLRRSDVVVANRISGLAALEELGMKDVKILKPALANFPVFHYLHKKNADLVPKLTAILSQMQRDKAIEKIQKTVMKSSSK